MSNNLLNNTQQTILLACSDTRPYSRIIKTLKYSYNLENIEHGHKAYNSLIKSNNIKAAIIDTDLQGLSGFQVVKRTNEYREENNLHHIPIMLVCKSKKDRNAIDRLKEYSDCLSFIPFDDGVFLTNFWKLCDNDTERDWENLNYAQSSILKITKRNIEKIFAIESGNHCQMGLVTECSNAVVDAARSNELDGVLLALRNHHSYSFVHNLKVSALMTIFGSHIGLKRNDLHMLAQGGLLHDIGKSQIPLGLLDKPGPLNETEWEEMKRHVIYSGNIMGNDSNVPSEILNIAMRHHEKMDGTGYPNGLKGTQLDDLSLIAQIADVYSALTDKRSYKPSLPKEKVIGIMKSMRSHHLEAGFLDKFLEILQDGKFH